MLKNDACSTALPALTVTLFSVTACGIVQSCTPGKTTLPTLTLVPTPVPEVLFVDAAQNLGKISPFVYGANFGPWVGVPVDLMDEAEQAGITYLRFPGGQWGDQNDLQDYQIDRFITLARRLGAEPKINVRLPGGSPEAAAELVRYCNITNNYNVRYWSIGNEPSLYTNVYGYYDTELYNTEWREFAEAMLAVDPEIILIGPEIHQFTGNPETDPKDEAGRDWTREFLMANGDLVDIVAIHRYPFPTTMTGPPKTIDDLRANSREWETIIPNLRVLIRSTTGRDLPIAVSEVNSDWSHATGGDATPDSFYNAIWWGDVLGRLIRQRVDIVAYFLLQSQTRTGGWGLLARFEVRPTYYVYQMYKHFGDELLYASSDDDDVSIFAARRTLDDAVTLMIVNLGPQDKRIPLVLQNVSPSGQAEVWLFDIDHHAELIGTENVVSGSTISLPPQSISLYILP
ncbi:MAG: hypothetical protein GTO14_00370 [Anaerolineales bacterium]|nr:hypothetical protein [Anaerolineales bacterium]